jgi:hypothetical protein
MSIGPVLQVREGRPRCEEVTIHTSPGPCGPQLRNFRLLRPMPPDPAAEPADPVSKGQVPRPRRLLNNSPFGARDLSPDRRELKGARTKRIQP